MDDLKKSKKADSFFKREFSNADIQKSAHFTFLDGFRLGFGFFVGFTLGLIIVSFVVSLVANLLRAF